MKFSTPSLGFCLRKLLFQFKGMINSYQNQVIFRPVCQELPQLTIASTTCRGHEANHTSHRGMATAIWMGEGAWSVREWTENGQQLSTSISLQKRKGGYTEIANAILSCWRNFVRLPTAHEYERLKSEYGKTIVPHFGPYPTLHLVFLTILCHVKLPLTRDSSLNSRHWEFPLIENCSDIFLDMMKLRDSSRLVMPS